MATTSILDLPIDILLLIFPYLDALSFLSLTATCKALHRPEFIHDHQYWSLLVRKTFRVPNQPVIQNDGQRWQKLFKRLATQSKIYTWGNNEKACLGHSYLSPEAIQNAGPPGLSRANVLRRRHISWPAEMLGTEEMGVISDLQCGGWSTSMLTSKGALYTVGVVDGLQLTPRRHMGQPRPPHEQSGMMAPTPLRYPPGFVQPHLRYYPATAVKQFSSGRAHILALSDSGWIWSWQNLEHAALHVKFLSHDTLENGNGNGRGTIVKVVAGWNKSAALIEATGIVLWEPLQRGLGEAEIEDAALILESAVVPKTGFRCSGGKSTSDGAGQGTDLEDAVGEVLNFVVLEEVVLFNTSSGKVFVAQIFWSDSEQRVGEPLELALQEQQSEDDQTTEDATFATDVQGSFHSFAIFTQAGEVLTSDQDHLMTLLRNEQSARPMFRRIPALQHKDVISVAFGDYHFHALHSSGYITSYGTEPGACGALGLGGHGDPEGRLRGIRYQAFGGDGRLVPHAYSEGRRVWFEEEKRQWIKFLTAGGVDPAEAAERMRAALGSPEVRCQGEVSEWIEQQGRDWESKFGVRGGDDDGLGAYFALSVTAAGWHSGALVLVNEDLALKVKNACEIPDRPNEGTDESVEDNTGGTSDNGSDTAPAPPSPSTQSPQIQQQTWASSLLLLALDYGRWFLGIAPYNAPPPAGYRPQTTRGDPARPGATAESSGFQRGTHARDFGQSPRAGVRYVWANEQFPRLKLSDGTEMPGAVPFDTWRYGRPEFDLDAGV